MKKQVTNYAYYCDLCGQQRDEGQLTAVYGLKDKVLRTFSQADVCGDCAKRPVADLLGKLYPGET